MKRALGLLATVIVCGCAAVSGPAASSARTEPTRSTAGGPYAVLVDESAPSSHYRIAAAAMDGTVVATTDAVRRPEHDSWIDLPYVSTTSKSLYYLDAGSAVMELQLDGSASRKIGELSVDANQEAAFAVSPDESLIAVSRLDFSRTPVHVTLFVGPFPSLSLKRIFESDSDYVWPVAWHGGLLVLAHAYAPLVKDALKAAPSRDNPYWAISYHLVDPATADRQVLMGACTVSGPLSPAGSACIQGGSIDWQGTVSPAWSTRDWGSISAAAALSPDGGMVAAADPDNPQRMDFWRPDGTIATWVDGTGGPDWAGWLDSTHVVISSGTIPGFAPRVVELSPGPAQAVSIEVSGFYAARLPTDIT